MAIKNPMTACHKFKQCYLTASIHALMLEYVDYDHNLGEVDVSLWPDVQRGGHWARMSLSRNIVGDLEELLNSLSPDLIDELGEFVTI